MRKPPSLSTMQKDYTAYCKYCKENNLQRQGFYSNFYNHWRQHYNVKHSKKIKKWVQEARLS